MPSAHDVARIRLDNAMLLFDEFVRATIAKPDMATLRGLERRFAERLEIQPSYWSQIKGRSRQIGERLARQFEHRCRKPVGWMDVAHSGAPSAIPAQASPVAAASTEADATRPQPQDDDERFIVGLVLTYYRRHPQRARTRLLDLLGEVLVPASEDAAAAPATDTSTAAKTPKAQKTQKAAAPAVKPPTPQDDLALWASSAAGIAPLKPKR